MTTRTDHIAAFAKGLRVIACFGADRARLSIPEADARALIDRSDLTPRTVHSLTDPDAIMAAVAQVRSEGHCIIDQEVELGLRSIAVPVLNVRGQVVAALNIGATVVQTEPADLVRACLHQMLTVQAGLQRVLG